MQKVFVAPQLQRDFKIPVQLTPEIGKHYLRFNFSKAVEKWLEQWIRMNLGELAKIFTGITDKNKELFVLLCLIILILVIDDFHIVKS